MDFSQLFSAIDAKPFRPFEIEIVSGRRVPVSHPENIIVAPTRQKVRHIFVYSDDPDFMAMIYPEGIAGLFFNGGNGGQEKA